IILGPVCSPHDKPLTGGLVVRWVTTSESPLLYVFFPTFLFPTLFLSKFFFVHFLPEYILKTPRTLHATSYQL
ncbi:hypothetical protein K458DRAFT_461524, partial [Lentithecium fluviatile CBS 122367]